MVDSDLNSLIDQFSNGTTSTLGFVISVLMVIAWWKIFSKADEPGWAAIIPFYNLYVLFKITWGKGLLFLTMFIPLVNIVFYIITSVKLCKAFGKGALFTLASIFFPNVTTLIMGFDNSSYLGVQ